jgi:hypothetical protein
MTTDVSAVVNQDITPIDVLRRWLMYNRTKSMARLTM